MKKQNNKRRYEREDCVVPVDGKKDSSFENIQTVDISKNGVGFISPKSLPVNKKIALELDLKPDKDSVVVMGQVKWVHRNPESKTYRIGLQFEELLAGSAPELNKYFNK